MITPEISVGILSNTTIRFRLNETFRIAGCPETVTGIGEAVLSKAGKMTVSFENLDRPFSGPLTLEPLDYDAADFELFDVVIGVQFHWERKENQRFKGSLSLLVEDARITAVNRLPLEDYLISVISSEMKATSSLQLLKAHAVISRSWLLAQKEKSALLNDSGECYQSVTNTDDSYIRWYDREDHSLYDVCADDHCQRYQGITRISTPIVNEAVRSTSGELLMYDGRICDTRFSKCCGGITEEFQNNWEPVRHPYLSRLVDNEAVPAGYDPDLTAEAAAAQWINATPPAFCNTDDPAILSQVLNDYDMETPDFYRWETTLSQQEISDLIRRKTDWDFGDILDLVPIERGASGRLIRLQIVGTKKTLIIGKELFIRKALSESHLYSSAFVVEKHGIVDGLPSKFVLKGAGWGHGVGLCQIGAAMMSAKGYDYKAILTHYFPGATMTKAY
ncbi:MAG: SpoIID/LytB domain-containing protein [Dysgonamonadaceae bacterium]|jgi:SpoIID/LytB domain protein|nr:SpoIID/LytB domain-containing protein [Dysgonamonadaceae bacterium]